MDDNNNILDIPIAILAGIGLIIYYSYHMITLYHVFKGSAFQISKKYLYCHLFIIFLLLIIRSIAEIFVDNITIYLIILSMSGITVIVGLIHFLYKFNHNLFWIVMHEKQKTSKTGNIIDNMSEISTLNTIAKQTLLSSTQILIILFMIGIATIYSLMSWNSYIAWSIFVWIFETIPIIINVTCIYLRFAVNNTIYKIVCRNFHIYCERRCDALAESALLNENGRGSTEI